MADVFISYSREDLTLARQLAEDLKGRGYKVWWDTELVGSDDFYEVILSALSAAKAAVVIWSKHSVKSRFVRDEARFALFHNKLVAVKTDELPIIEVPFGFQSQQTDRVVDVDRVCAGLKKLGVPAIAASKSGLTAEALKTATNPQALMDFIATADDGAARRQAAARLMELGAAGTPVGSAMPASAPASPAASAPVARPAVTREVRSLMTGSLGAFMQGLLLRVPEFQLERQGFITSIGVIISVIVLCATLLGAVVGAIRSFNLPPGLTSGLIIAAGSGIACLLLYRYSRRFFASRNWGAGALLSFFLVLTTLPLTLPFGFFIALSIWGSSVDSPSGLGQLLPTLAVVELITILAIYLSVRPARR